MRASQNVAKSLELDRQRLASRGRSGVNAVGTSDSLEERGLDDGSPRQDMTLWRGQPRTAHHHSEWRLVKNSQALLQVTKKQRVTSPHPEVLRSQDYQSFISKVLNSRWLMIRSTGHLRSLYGPLFGDGAELDRSKILGEATQAVHAVKVSTAHTCWYEHLKPAKDEYETLNIKYKSLREQFHKARESYLHEVTALRDEVRFRGNPEDGLPEVNVVYFLEPNMLLTDAEQDFALKVVSEKLKMIFERNSKSSSGIDVGQFERLQENAQSRELEDMRIALKRSMEKLAAAELALSDQRRQQHQQHQQAHGSEAHTPEVVGTFKERLVHALEMQVDEVRALLEEQRRENRAERARAEELAADVERYATGMKEERTHKLLLQGKLNSASSQLAAQTGRNETLEEEVRSLNKMLRVNKSELKDLKAQLRRFTVEQMAICPSCGSATEMEVTPTTSEQVPSTPTPKAARLFELGQDLGPRRMSSRRAAKGKLAKLEQPESLGRTETSPLATPKQPSALAAPPMGSEWLVSSPQARQQALGAARATAESEASLGDASTGQRDANTSVFSVSGISATSIGDSPSQTSQPPATADLSLKSSAVPAELLVTSGILRERESDLRDALIGKEEALRRVDDLETQLTRMKSLLRRHVRGLAHAQSFRLLDSSDDLLAQAEALGCRKGLKAGGAPQAEAPMAAVPEEARPGEAAAGQVEVQTSRLLVDEAVQASYSDGCGSSTAALAAKCRELQELLDAALATLHGNLKQGDTSETDEAAAAGGAEKDVSVMEAQMEVSRLQREKQHAEARLVAAHARQACVAVATDREEEEDGPCYPLPNELDATKKMLASTQRLCEDLTEQIARLTEENANMSSTLSKVQDTLHKAADSAVESNADGSPGAKQSVTHCVDLITEALNHSVYFPLADGDTLTTSVERNAHLQELMQDTLAAIVPSADGNATECTQAGQQAAAPEAGADECPGLEEPAATAAVGASRHEAAAPEAGAAECSGLEQPAAMAAVGASRHEAPGLLDDTPDDEPDDDPLELEGNDGSNTWSGSPLDSPHDRQSDVALHSAGVESRGTRAERTADHTVPATAESNGTALARRNRPDVQLPSSSSGQGQRRNQRPRQRSAPPVPLGPDYEGSGGSSGSRSGVENGTSASRFSMSTRDPEATPPGSLQQAASSEAPRQEHAAAVPLRTPAVPAGPCRPGRSLQPASPEDPSLPPPRAPAPPAGSPRPGRPLLPAASLEANRQPRSVAAVGAREELGPSAASAAATEAQDATPETGWEPGTGLGEEELLRQLHESRQQTAEAEARCQRLRDVLCQHVQGVIGLRSEELLENAEKLSEEAEALHGDKGDGKEDAQPPMKRFSDRSTVPALEAQLRETDESLSKAMSNLQQEADAGADSEAAGPPDPARLARAVEAQKEVDRLQRAKIGVEAQILTTRVNESQNSMAVAAKAMKDAESRGTCGCACKGCSCKLRVDAMSKLLDRALQLCSESTSKLKNTAEDNFTISSTLSHVQGLVRKASIAFDASDAVRTALHDERVRECWEMLKQAERESVFARLYHNRTRSRARRDERMQFMLQDLHRAMFYRKSDPLPEVRELASPIGSPSPTMLMHKPRRRSNEEKENPRMAMMPERQEHSLLPTVSVRFDPDQHLLNQTKVGGVSAPKRSVDAAPLNVLPDHTSAVDKRRASLPGMGAGHARRQSGGRSLSPNPHMEQAPRALQRPASTAPDASAASTRPRRSSQGRPELRG